MMKRTENFRIGRKNLVVVLATLVLVISSLITACGSSTTETISGVTEEVATVDKEAVQTEVAAEVETENVTEIETEPVTEKVEETEVTQTIELSGEAWVSTLEYEEPKLVVWNDETGTKEVIEQGGKYVMQEGDTIGIYCPKNYFLYNVFPMDFAEGLRAVATVGVIEYNLPSESQDINLEAELMNPQQEFERYNYVITTP